MSTQLLPSEPGHGTAAMVESGWTFAGRLRELREAAELSQYALARRSGVSKQMLSKLELGEREPSWVTVQKLAAALGVDCTEFNDPGLTVPGGAGAEPTEPARPRGRPRKSPEPAPPAAESPAPPPGPSPAEPQAEQPPKGKRERKPAGD